MNKRGAKNIDPTKLRKHAVTVRLEDSLRSYLDSKGGRNYLRELLIESEQQELVRDIFESEDYSEE